MHTHTHTDTPVDCVVITVHAEGTDIPQKHMIVLIFILKHGQQAQKYSQSIKDQFSEARRTKSPVVHGMRPTEA